MLQVFAYAMFCMHFILSKDKQLCHTKGTHDGLPKNNLEDSTYVDWTCVMTSCQVSEALITAILMTSTYVPDCYVYRIAKELIT